MTDQNYLAPVNRALWVPIPASQLRRTEDKSIEGRWWASEGDDPQFHILLDNPLAAGWYRVSARLQAPAGQRLEPCFYPDYGHGIAESARIPLHYAHASRMLDSAFHLSEDTRMLRFDPMACEGRFLLGDLKIQRLAGREALWLMLHQLLNASRLRRPIDAMRLAASVREQRESNGNEAALEWLWARYAEGSGAQDAFYQEWIGHQEALPGPVFELSDLGAAPVFTLVLLGRQRDARLPKLLNSIAAQSFPDWELLAPNTLFESESDLDDGHANKRIRVLSLTGSSTADWMKQAADASQGRYIMFVNAAGCLHEDALANFAAYFQEASQARMLYGDEDYLDSNQVRHTPYFKPDWNPELLLSQDYVSQALMLDVGLARDAMAGGLQEGAEVYDLALRCSEKLHDDGIGHVPRIVRHNIDDGGVDPSGFPASAGIADPNAATQAVSKHLVRQGIHAEVRALSRGTRVRYLPSKNPVYVDIIIPTRDRVDLLSRCVDSVLERTTWPDFRITIVDNGSEQLESIEYLSMIRQQDRVRILSYDHPFNYSAINNFAVSQSDADLLVLLNNDIEVISPDWLSELVALAMRPNSGAVGAKLYYPDNTIQHAGVILGVKGVAAHPYLRQRRDFPGQFGRALLTQNLSAVTAACLAVRRELFNEVGGLDESIAVAFNDVDFCLRLQSLGYRNIWTPYAELYHHESATRGYEDNPQKQARFAAEVNTMRERWGARLDDDPAYSPNLSLVGNPFDIDPARIAPLLRVPTHSFESASDNGRERVVVTGTGSGGR